MYSIPQTNTRVKLDNGLEADVEEFSKSDTEIGFSVFFGNEFSHCYASNYYLDNFRVLNQKGEAENDDRRILDCLDIMKEFVKGSRDE